MHRPSDRAAAPRCQRRDDRFEHHQAVGAAERRLAGALRMRHHADDVARARCRCRRSRGPSRSDSPRRRARPVRVGVAEDRPAGCASSSLEHLRRREVVALAVRDRNPQHLARRGAPRVNGVSVCSTRTWTCSQRYFSPRLRSIAPGSRPASSRIWKPLQMPSTGPPRVGERAHRRHDRREARHRAGAQVVAVREAAGQDHDVGALQVVSLCQMTRACWPSTSVAA